MKNLKTILFVILAGVFTLQSCQQEVIEPQEEQTELTSETRLWWVPFLVYIIVKLSEGQHQGNGDCQGIGSCGNHSMDPGTGQGTGSTYNPEYVGDYESPAFFGVTKTGEVILAMDENSDPEAKAAMFYDNEIYMSPTQIIDNPNVLEELGLTSPVVIEEGYYEVLQQQEVQYIIIQ